MDDDKFLQLEYTVQEALNEFKDACEENGDNFQERAADLVYNAENKD